MDITFEMDLNLKVVARDGYTILDWISDIGGIQGILISALAIIIGYWNYNFFDNFMVSNLYRIQRSSKPDRHGKKGPKAWQQKQDKEKGDKMTISFCSGIRDAICDMVPECMQCCRHGRNETGLQMGRDKLAQETNIIKIVQSRRYLNAAIKLLLPKDKRKRLKEQTKYWMLQVDKQPKFGQEGDDESSISMHTSQINCDGDNTDPEMLFINDFAKVDNVDVTARSKQSALFPGAKQD